MQPGNEANEVRNLCTDNHCVFYRVDSWTWNGGWQTNFILQPFQSPSCDLLQAYPEEDHKTVIKTLQNKICLPTTVPSPRINSIEYCGAR